MHTHIQKKKNTELTWWLAFFLRDSSLKGYMCSILLFYLQNREFEPMELL